MYISHQALEALHQENVNEGLRRSERRRMLQAWKKQQDNRGKGWTPRATVRGLARSMRALLVHL
ncbi:MAG TPA: hypothetical protein VFB58_03155 [Chloroflexota bacterium]|nr:hypothetical protein [Chloroflexota bacterium]